MRRFKFKRKNIFNDNPKRNILILTFVMLIIFIILVFKVIDKKVTPVFMGYAEAKATKIATLIITQAVNDKIFEVMDVEELIVTNKNTNGTVKEININPITVNKLLNMITNYVQEYLEKLEEGDIDSLGVSDSVFSNYDIHKLKEGIIYEIPSGAVFNNTLLSNLGPKIPVRISLVGDVISDIETNISDYGINNALVEVIVRVDVSIKVILPFASKTVSVTTNIPIVMKIIEGEVPHYYYPRLDTST